jgi:hypothetical protein
MDEWFKAIAAEYDLPEGVALQLRDAGYVVMEGAIPDAKCAQLSEAYEAAVLAAHPDDVSIRSSTRVHDFVNRGPDFDKLYIYGPLLAACCRVIGRLSFAKTSSRRQMPDIGLIKLQLTCYIRFSQVIKTKGG